MKNNNLQVEQDARVREPGLLLVYKMIELRGKMCTKQWCTTTHMNFDDELMMNKWEQNTTG